MVLLHLGSVLKPLANMDIGGHMEDHGLGHNLLPFWNLGAILQLGL